MFKYNGKIWNPKNPEKKLKQLGITWNDVEIINNPIKSESVIEYEDPERLYYYVNKETGYSIVSIHPYCNEPNYEQCTKKYLEDYWNKNGKI